MSCIVVYDDGDSVCCPMTWDDDCEGAICCGTGPVALFHDAKLARAAIRISANYAALCQSQGKPTNCDFLPSNRKHVKIRKLQELRSG